MNIIPALLGGLAAFVVTVICQARFKIQPFTIQYWTIAIPLSILAASLVGILMRLAN